MPDRLFFPLALLAAAALTLLASVYPQGVGQRSPPPFGHATAAELAARAKAAAPKPEAAGARPELRGPL